MYLINHRMTIRDLVRQGLNKGSEKGGKVKGRRKGAMVEGKEGGQLKKRWRCGEIKRMWWEGLGEGKEEVKLHEKKVEGGLKER